MTTSKRWLCFSSIIVAGLFGLLLSFLGGFGLLWGGFPGKNHSALLLLMFFPYLLAFPLFALATGVTKTAIYALWLVIPLPWIAVIQISIPFPQTGLIGFLRSVATCAYISVPLFVFAALVQYGSHFYEFTHNGQWVKWKESIDGSEA
jgi:hypothetical protein